MTTRENALEDDCRLGRHQTLLDVNAHIREAAVGFDGAAAEAKWQFMCECGADDCTALVRLTVPEYDLLKDAGAPVLADGHQQPRAARERRYIRA